MQYTTVGTANIPSPGPRYQNMPVSAFPVSQMIAQYQDAQTKLATNLQSMQMRSPQPPFFNNIKNLKTYVDAQLPLFASSPPTFVCHPRCFASPQPNASMTPMCAKCNPSLTYLPVSVPYN